MAPPKSKLMAPPKPKLMSPPPPGAGPLDLAAGLSPDDSSKKIRKPYTISKVRERWTDLDHDKFLEAFHLFGREWKKIEAFVGSKSVIQIRSHAQKYFTKVKDTNEHVPPARAKKRAAHPYPQNSNKDVAPLSHATIPVQGSRLLEPVYAVRTDSASVLKHSSSSATASSWPQSSAQPIIALQVSNEEDIGSSGAVIINNYACSSNESSPRARPDCDTTDHGNQVPSRGKPDFAKVYSFIGSMFEPGTSGHFQILKEMDPIDAETILLCMKNISMNLTSLDFEDHLRLICAYGAVGSEAQGNQKKPQTCF